jgi:hypothetical protein
MGYISANKDNFFLDPFQKQGVTVLTLETGLELKRKAEKAKRESGGVIGFPFAYSWWRWGFLTLGLAEASHQNDFVGGFVLGELLLDARSAELATGSISDGPHLGEEIALGVHVEDQRALQLLLVGFGGVGHDDGGIVPAAVDALEDQSGRAVSERFNTVFPGGQSGLACNECEGDLHPEGLLCLNRRSGR